MRKKTKQSFSMLISVAMIFSMFAGINLSVSAENDILDYLEWEIIDGEVTITGCDRTISGDVVIPDTIEDYPVTTIGDYAFCDCNKLTSIDISDSVRTIGVGAFRDCWALTSISIPDGVKEISRWMVAYCRNLTNIDIPDSVTVIGDEAFMHCEKLKNIELPENLTTLVDGAFSCCFRLESLIIPDGIDKIGVSLFYYCLSLKTVTIPESVKSIMHTAFQNCYSLEQISLPENLDYNEGGFFGCNKMTDCYVYNPEISLNGVGYTNYELLVDFDEFVDKFDDIFDRIDYQEEIKKIMVEYTEPQKCENLVIHGYDGSTAEIYAKEHGFKFESLGQYEPPVEEEPEVPEIPDVPETPEKPEENKPENDFFGMLREFFEKIVNFFKRIFETFKNLFE